MIVKSSQLYRSNKQLWRRFIS